MTDSAPNGPGAAALKIEDLVVRYGAGEDVLRGV
jgi:hypothetical protein